MTLGLALVTQDFPPEIGGIQTYSHALARALAPHVARLVVFAPSAPGAAAFDREAPYPVVRVAGPRDYLRVLGLPALALGLRRHRADVVLTTTWGLAATALAAGPWPVFSAAHGQELLKSLVPGPLTPLYVRHRRHTLRRLRGVFPVSRFTAGLVAADGVPAERIHVVPNGVDVAHWLGTGTDGDALALARRLGLPPGAPLALTVARLVTRKGIDTVLRALPEVLSQRPDLHYLVAGDGPDRARLEALASALGVARQVHFLGRCDDLTVRAAYRAATFFIMPARAELPSVEGFGLVFREAHVFGKPVIGTPTGGIPDAIREGVDGLLVPPDDAPATARAMLRLVAEPGLARALGEAGREHALIAGTWAHAARAIARVLTAARAPCASS